MSHSSQSRRQPLEAQGASDPWDTVLAQFDDLFGRHGEPVFLVDQAAVPGRILECNDAAIRRYGYERHELVGRQLLSLAITGGDPAELRQRLNTLLTAGATQHEEWHRDRHGAEFAVSVSSSLARIGGRELQISICHPLPAKEEPPARAALFEAAFRRATRAQVLIDADTGRIVDANTVALRSTGYERGGFIGRDLRTLDLYCDLATPGLLMEEAAGADSVLVLDTEIRVRSGNRVAVSLSAERFTLGGASYLLVTAQNIAGQKAMERALLENEERYRAFIEQTSDAVFRLEIDPPIEVDLPEDEQIDLLYDRGVIAEANAAFARIYGFERAEDVVGLRRSDLSTRDAWRARADVAAMVRSGYRIEGQVWHMVDSQGDRRTFTVSTVGTVEGGLLHRIWYTERDLTDNFLVQEALTVSEQRLRTITENAPLGLFVLDGQGTFTYAAGAVFARIGIDPVATLVGRPVAEVFAASKRGQELSAAAMRGERLSVSEDIFGVPVDISTTPIFDPEGRLTGVIGVMIDATDRRRADIAMIQAQKFESIGILAGGLAHDFNNLLVGILGNADLALAQLPADDPIVPALQDVVTAAQRARELTSQMLTVSGKQQTPGQDVDLNALTRETLQLLRVSVPQHIVLEDSLDPALPRVKADPTQMRQIIMNLIINAAEAIGDAGGAVRTSSGLISVQDEAPGEGFVLPPRPGEYTYIEVRDTGVGMDDATLARVFDPFFTTKDTGHGLGLPSVLGIVRGHGGTIRVRSTLGEGSTFQVLLPAPPVAAPAEGTGGGEADPRVTPNRTSVLVVEDDDAIRSMLGRAMEARGHRPLLARDGVEGVETFRAHVDTIACVVMDIMMPRMNGLDALKEMREHRDSVPVILMSGYVENEIPARLIGTSVAAFIRKPFRLGDLDEVLRQVMPPAEAS